MLPKEREKFVEETKYIVEVMAFIFVKNNVLIKYLHSHCHWDIEKLIFKNGSE